MIWRRLMVLGMAVGGCVLVVEIALVRMMFAPVVIAPYDTGLPEPARVSRWGEGSENTGPKEAVSLSYHSGIVVFGEARKASVCYIHEADGEVTSTKRRPHDCTTVEQACNFSQLRTAIEAAGYEPGEGDEIRVVGGGGQ